MPPCCRSRSQGLPMPIWSLSEWGRYCVNTATSVMPELTQLLSAKSIMRYLPAKGTAGLALFWESRLNRSPCPPAKITANTLLIPQPSFLQQGGGQPTLPCKTRGSRAGASPPYHVRLGAAGRGPAPPLLCIAVGAMPCACPAWFIISYRQQQGRGKPSPYGIYRFVLVGHSHDESGSYRLSRPTKDGWVGAMPCACPAADALCSPCACPAADALCSPCACPVTDVKCPHML